MHNLLTGKSAARRCVYLCQKIHGAGIRSHVKSGEDLKKKRPAWTWSMDGY